MLARIPEKGESQSGISPVKHSPIASRNSLKKAVCYRFKYSVQSMQDFKQNMRPARILVFDSGVGGLSVLSEIGKRLPEAALTFACDNAAFPYGTLSEQRLMDRVVEVIEQLMRETRPDLVVVACNTASTLVLDELRRRFDIPFVGVVPAIKPAAALSTTKVMGLLATPATIERNYTDALIADFAPDCKILRIGSSEMVYMAEKKLRGVAPDKETLKEILKPFSEHEELDSVVLACTHFPLLIEDLKPLLSDHIHWVDSGEAIARRVESLITPAPSESAQTSAKPIAGMHRALMTAADRELESLSQQVRTFGLNPFEIFSV